MEHFKATPEYLDSADAVSEELGLELDFARVSRETAHETSPYTLFSPLHYEAGYAYPLLVWLHTPSRNDERQLMRIMPVISMRNYVAVAPRGIPLEEGGYGWPQTPEGVHHAEREIFRCIASAKQRCHIAPDRIFLAGFDAGGTMAFRTAMCFPEQFAGVVSLCGGVPINQHLLRRWESARQLPAMMAVGRDSEEFSPSLACQNLRLFHTAGMSVSVRQYPCAQELSQQMLKDLNRWIMELICGETLV